MQVTPRITPFDIINHVIDELLEEAVEIEDEVIE